MRQLSEAVERRGLAMAPPVLSNLELGRRPTISIAEWLLLAAVLQVPPLMLLFPVGRTDAVEALPGIEVTPWAAVCWAEHGRIEGVDPDLPDDALAIPGYRRHEEFIRMWEQSRYEARRVRVLLDKPIEHLGRLGEDPVELRLELADRERLEERAVVMLGQVRRTLRRAHLLLPPLPSPLQRLVDDEVESS